MKRRQDERDRTGLNRVHTFDILYLLLEGIESGMLHGDSTGIPSLGQFFAGQNVPMERQRWTYAWEFLIEEEFVSGRSSIDSPVERMSLTQDGSVLLSVLRVRYNDPRSLLYVKGNSSEPGEFVRPRQPHSVDSSLTPHLPPSALSSMFPAEVPTTHGSRARDTERITAQKERHKQSFQHQRFEGRDR